VREVESVEQRRGIFAVVRHRIRALGCFTLAEPALVERQHLELLD
jgi:hypothetical protein